MSRDSSIKLNEDFLNQYQMNDDEIMSVLCKLLDNIAQMKMSLDNRLIETISYRCNLEYV